MSIRLDPRRVGILKRLAAEEGVRPGELAVRWLEERLDSVRVGVPSPGPAAPSNAALDELIARMDELSLRVDRLAAAPAAPSAALTATAPSPRPGARKARRTKRTRSAGPRTPLHAEIIAVLGERGPQTAAELASAIVERGRYQPPRSGKPIDAAMVNGRVSNPTYRGRFTRSGGRIGLADG
jgi:hypothetical protein